MSYFSILLTSFCNILLLTGMYVQDNIVKDGFYVQVNLEKNEVYLSDINEARYRVSPKNSRDIPIGLYAINVQFLKERNEMEKRIFSEDEISRFIEYRIVARIYIKIGLRVTFRSYEDQVVLMSGLGNLWDLSLDLNVFHDIVHYRTEVI